MKHCILVKWNNSAVKPELADAASLLFEEARAYPWVEDVIIHRNCIARDNRYDLFVELIIEKNDLERWDHCAVHKKWKIDFNSYIESKAVLDYE